MYNPLTLLSSKYGCDVILYQMIVGREIVMDELIKHMPGKYEGNFVDLYA
jgi:hypothetical protein